MGIGKSSHRLVVSLAGYKDSLDEAEKSMTTIIAVQNDSSWNPYEEDGLQFFKAAELDGSFFLAAYDLGVCTLDLNSGTKQKRAQFPPPYRQADSLRQAHKICTRREKLYDISHNVIYARE